MAQRTVVHLEDDLDGSAATETVYFGMDGTAFEIDLNEGNAEALRRMLQPYVDAARHSGGRRETRRQSALGNGRTKASPPKDDVREWARAHGHRVSERGRIPVAVMEAYESSH